MMTLDVDTKGCRKFDDFEISVIVNAPINKLNYARPMPLRPQTPPPSSTAPLLQHHLSFPQTANNLLGHSTNGYPSPRQLLGRPQKLGLPPNHSSVHIPNLVRYSRFTRYHCAL